MADQIHLQESKEPTSGKKKAVESFVFFFFACVEKFNSLQ